jgi:hypothetical protein
MSFLDKIHREGGRGKREKDITFMRRDFFSSRDLKSCTIKGEFEIQRHGGDAGS